MSKDCHFFTWPVSNPPEWFDGIIEDATTLWVTDEDEPNWNFFSIWISKDTWGFQLLYHYRPFEKALMKAKWYFDNEKEELTPSQTNNISCISVGKVFLSPIINYVKEKRNDLNFNNTDTSEQRTSNPRNRERRDARVDARSRSRFRGRVVQEVDRVQRSPDRESTRAD